MKRHPESYVHDLGERVDNLVRLDVLVEVDVLAIVFKLAKVDLRYLFCGHCDGLRPV